MAYPEDLYPAEPEIQDWDWVPPEWDAAPGPAPLPFESESAPYAESQTLAPPPELAPVPEPEPAPAPVPEEPAPPPPVETVDPYAGLRGISDAAQGAWDGLAGAVSDAGQSISDTVAPVGGAIAGGIQDAAAPMVDAAETEAAEQERVRQIAGADDKALAGMEASQKHDQEQAQADALFEKLKADDQRTQDNYKAFKDAQADTARRMEELQQEVDEISNMEVDPGRYFKNANAAQIIGGAFSAILGGMLNPGGENSGIALIQRQIDQDIDAQKADIANRRAGVSEKRGVVSELYEQGKDLHTAAETARLAAYQRIDKELAAEMAKYDPNGTAVLRIARARMEVQKRIDEKTEETRRWNEEQALRERQQDTAAKNARTSAGQLGLAKKQFATDTLFRGIDLVNKSQKAFSDQNAANSAGVLVSPWGGGLGVSRFAGDEKLMHKDQEKLNGYKEYLDRAAKFEQMAKKLGPVWTTHDRLAGDQVKAYNAAYTEMMVARVKATTGAQASDQERAEIAKTIPRPDTVFQRGSNRLAAATMIENTVDDMKGFLVSRGINPKPIVDQFRQQQAMQSGNAPPGELGEAEKRGLAPQQEPFDPFSSDWGTPGEDMTEQNRKDFVLIEKRARSKKDAADAKQVLRSWARLSPSPEMREKSSALLNKLELESEK